MYAQDFLAADHVGVGNLDLAIEAARTQKGWIEHVGPVGRGQNDDAFVGLETVHLDEELVQRLLALVVAAAQARATMATDGVDFVDEDDAGRVLLGLIEHVAHARGAHAHEHLHEVGARDGEERHVGFTSDSARDQRLAGARRSNEQATPRDATAEPLEFLRVAQEFHDLLQIDLGFVDAGHVFEGHPPRPLRQQLGFGLAKAHGAPAARLHLAHEEHPDADQQQHREPRHQHAEDGGHVLVGGLHVDAHTLAQQARDEVGVFGRQRLERPVLVGEIARDLLPLDGDIRDVALIDLGDEFGISDLIAFAGLRGVLEEVEQRKEQQANDDPDCKIAEMRLHEKPFLVELPAEFAQRRAWRPEPCRHSTR